MAKKFFTCFMNNMNTRILNYNQYYTPSFGSRKSAVSKKDIEKLMSQGKNNHEMADALNISHSWFKTLKRRFELVRPKSKYTNAEIAELIKQGKSDKEIAALSNAGIRRIGDIRRGLGIKFEFRKKPTDPNIIENIKKYAAEGKSIKEISKLIGKSEVRTSVLLKQLKIENPKYLKIKEQLRNLIAEGKSTTEITQILNKNRYWVYYMRKKFKI